ncbi:MAG: FAD:protein FMN transferase [Pseudomonadales bacterium]|nr:FAD:protein FMN transferase [Pseudomonadales bacterium]
MMQATLRSTGRIAALCATLCLATEVAADWIGDARSKMGTSVEVQFWHEDAEEGARLLEAAMAEFDRIEAAMSTYSADSEITRVNADAAFGPMVISEDLYEVVAQSLEVSRLSDGAFDITYESVGHLYALRDRVRPDDAAIAEKLPAIDHRHVVLDHDARTIAFTVPGVRINVGGIAKGWACERVVDLLRDAGVEHALVSAGGDTRLLGDRRGQPWLVGIRDPDDAAGVVTRLALVDEAISTSGDYERYFDEDGVRYHHILDPATGRPTEGIRSVTVIGPDGTITDALSTTLFVLGPERGMALLDDLPAYDAVFIEAGHVVRLSSGLASR